MLFIAIILVIVVFLAFLYFNFRENNLIQTVTKTHRGTRTERKLVFQLLNAGFPAITVYHDLYLQNRNGRSTQIDVALATKVGIIVFEVKDYSGWIYGSVNQMNWTQVLAYRKEKHRFYNPILQNQRHFDNLKTKLTDFQHSVGNYNYNVSTFKQPALYKKLPPT